MELCDNGYLSRVYPVLSPYSSWDRIQLPQNPQLDKQEKMDGWTEERKKMLFPFK